MHVPPTQGVKGVKPRLKTAKEEIPKLSREYLEIRNRQMRAKAFLAETQAAARRGELIERKLWAPQLAGLTDVHEIRTVLEGAARSVLEELQDLPSKVTDPNWLEGLGENGEKPGPPWAQGQPPAPQAKAKARRR